MVGALRHVGSVPRMGKPTAFDEQFVHQIPELLPNVVTHHQYWRHLLLSCRVPVPLVSRRCSER